MFKTLVTKELKAILMSPKFAATFGACSILILLSVFMGIREYRATQRQHDTAVALSRQEMQETTAWMRLSSTAFRSPDPLQVLVSGVQNDVGRLSAVTDREPIRLTNSVYSDDPIFALFRIIDFCFIVQVVLSLFAILFTYDAICGERETGTLRLAFSNPIGRARYLLAKLTGAWLGLVLPLSIPVGLAILMMLVGGVPLGATDWARLVGILGVSILYFTFFVVLGLLVSSLTRRSSDAFLLSLVTWVLLVLIVPRVGVMAAARLVQVPSIAQVEGQRSALAKEIWEKEIAAVEEHSRDLGNSMAGLCPVERNKREGQEEPSDEWSPENRFAEVRRQIGEADTRLLEDLRGRQAAQRRAAFTLARVSPAAAYQLAAMSLAQTDPEMKDRYESAMNEYRDAFVAFKEKKMKESGSGGGIRIKIDSENGVHVDPPKETGQMDLSGLPGFVPPRPGAAGALASSLVDLAWLTVAGFAAFAGAFGRFVRYDVR
jgi:ABC-type transport system involved in multi-copper enzyme maturation permease subunit